MNKDLLAYDGMITMDEFLKIQTELLKAAIVKDGILEIGAMNNYIWTAYELAAHLLKENNVAVQGHEFNKLRT
jgi:hypothetical protein